jgi:hypothetical protein
MNCLLTKKPLLQALYFAAVTLLAWIVFSSTETYEISLLRRSFSAVDDPLLVLDHANKDISFNDEQYYLKSILRFAHPGVRVPVISRDDFRAINWSNDKQVYRIRRGMKIYHNYTVYYNTDGKRQKQFTKFEFIPKPENIIRKRGFTVDYTTDPANVKYIAQNLDTYEDQRQVKGGH